MISSQRYSSRFLVMLSGFETPIVFIALCHAQAMKPRRNIFVPISYLVQTSAWMTGSCCKKDGRSVPSVRPKEVVFYDVADCVWYCFRDGRLFLESHYYFLMLLHSCMWADKFVICYLHRQVHPGHCFIVIEKFFHYLWEATHALSCRSVKKSSDQPYFSFT